MQGRIVVVGSSWALPRRVMEELHGAGFDDVQLVGPDELAELQDDVAVLVHLAAGDHDALARRRRSAAFGAGELLEAAAAPARPPSCCCRRRSCTARGRTTRCR